MNRPEYIIIHTAAFRGDVSAATIDRWHKANGWRSIGYHYVIRKDGTIEQGRGEDEIGAHARQKGMNRKSIGICLSGHGDYESWTAEQWLGLSILFSDIKRRYHIPAQNVLGHRELGAKKTCPGKLVDMDYVRFSLASICDGRLDVHGDNNYIIPGHNMEPAKMKPLGLEPLEVTMPDSNELPHTMADGPDTPKEGLKEIFAEFLGEFSGKEEIEAAVDFLHPFVDRKGVADRIERGLIRGALKVIRFFARRAFKQWGIL